jgi:hypothetical protein
MKLSGWSIASHWVSESLTSSLRSSILAMI